MRKGSWKKALTAALTLGLLVAACVPAAAAGQADGPYTYKLRIFAGEQGKINGGAVWELPGLGYGSRVSIGRSSVTVVGTDGTRESYPVSMASENQEKYYYKGVRESGKDNNTAQMAAPAFTVDRDVDYVMAYGISGATVAYTVRYEDADGNELAPSETYYGNVGDKPVVAYLYIDGYEPQAYNLTRTLTEDPEKNNFTFIYTPVGAIAPVAGTEEGGGTAPAGGAGGTAAAGGGAPAAGAAAGGAGAPAAGAAAGAGEAAAAAPAAGTEGGGLTEVPEEGTPAAGPQELVDLDEGEVPLAGQDLGDDGTAAVSASDFARPLADLPLPAKIGIGAALLAAAVAGIWYFLARKKRKKEDA